MLFSLGVSFLGIIFNSNSFQGGQHIPEDLIHGIENLQIDPNNLPIPGQLVIRKLDLNDPAVQVFLAQQREMRDAYKAAIDERRREQLMPTAAQLREARNRKE